MTEKYYGWVKNLFVVSIFSFTQPEESNPRI